MHARTGHGQSVTEQWALLVGHKNLDTKNSVMHMRGTVSQVS